LDNCGFVASFSHKGHPYDNSTVESFNGIIKKEEIFRKKYNTLSQAKLAIFEYIEGFYNPRRQHSTINYLSPDEYKNEYYKNLNAIK